MSSGNLIALPIKPMGNRSKDDIEGEGGSCGSGGRGGWRAEKDVALNAEHHNAKDRRAEPTDGIERLRSSQVQDHSTKQKERFERSASWFHGCSGIGKPWDRRKDSLSQ
jgi:hypothetical protein